MKKGKMLFLALAVILALTPALTLTMPTQAEAAHYRCFHGGGRG